MENLSKFDMYLLEISSNKFSDVNDRRKDAHIRKMKEIDRIALIDKEKLRRSKEAEIERDKRKKEQEKRSNVQRAIDKLKS